MQEFHVMFPLSSSHLFGFVTEQHYHLPESSFFFLFCSVFGLYRL